jgi:hypothetical protein
VRVARCPESVISAGFSNLPMPARESCADFSWFVTPPHARSRELCGFQLARHTSPCPLARVARPDAHRALPLRGERRAGPFTMHNGAADGRSGPPFRIGLLSSSSREIDLAKTGLSKIQGSDSRLKSVHISTPTGTCTCGKGKRRICTIAWHAHARADWATAIAIALGRNSASAF